MRPGAVPELVVAAVPELELPGAVAEEVAAVPELELPGAVAVAGVKKRATEPFGFIAFMTFGAIASSRWM
jgi:hypothetical protein